MHDLSCCSHNRIMCSLISSIPYILSKASTFLLWKQSQNVTVFPAPSDFTS
nr:MAG TPA: hypothetical protein [Caudoviricetes sp.]